MTSGLRAEATVAQDGIGRWLQATPAAMMHGASERCVKTKLLHVFFYMRSLCIHVVFERLRSRCRNTFASSLCVQVGETCLPFLRAILAMTNSRIVNKCKLKFYRTPHMQGAAADAHLSSLASVATDQSHSKRPQNAEEVKNSRGGNSQRRCK